MEQFDAIIIGIGQAGNPLASELSSQGLKIAIIEREHPGGSCVNYGCTPTKTMVASAQVKYMATRADDFGIDIQNDINTDFKKVISRRDEIVLKSREGITKRLEDDKHVDLIMGEASFTGSKEIKVSTEDGVRYLTADKIFINVGTSPRIPTIDGLKGIEYYTAKTMMQLQQLPEHLLIMGGGYIGIEFGQMYARLGSKVTIIEGGGQLAAREDEDVAAEIKTMLEDEGVEVILNTKVESVSQDSGTITVTTDKGKNISASHLLIAIGTTPATDALNLFAAGIKTDDKGYIKVNARLETNVEGVYALGDCKGGPEFTHIAYDDFRIVRDNLFGEGKSTTGDRMVPYTMFTKPELGRVGINEKEAKEKGIDYKVAKIPVSKIARATENGDKHGLLKILIDSSTDNILGVACMTETGGEMMTVIQMAMVGNLKYQQIRDMVFAHPIYSEAFNNLLSEIK